MTRPSTRILTALALLLGASCAAAARADTVTFFDLSQLAEPVSSGLTSDTIRSNGYLFTCSRDKFFTGGVGLTEPVGRYIRVPWPDGVEAQAVTVAPPGGSTSKARIIIQREDGDVFDLTAFEAKLLANTAGAGGSFEVATRLHGEDGLQDPVVFNATGNAGNVFSYNESPSYLGTTSLLKGFDTYEINLYVDFALTGLTLEGAPILTPEPSTLALATPLALLLIARRPRRT